MGCAGSIIGDGKRVGRMRGASTSILRVTDYMHTSLKGISRGNCEVQDWYERCLGWLHLATPALPLWHHHLHITHSPPLKANSSALSISRRSLCQPSSVITLLLSGGLVPIAFPSPFLPHLGGRWLSHRHLAALGRARAAVVRCAGHRR